MVFYAQSTITVISGRWVSKGERERRWGRERERERERERDGKGGRERERKKLKVRNCPDDKCLNQFWEARNKQQFARNP